MNNLQKYFEKFDEIIKLDTENDDLRKSRDAIKSKIVASIEEYFADKSIPKPTFFDQGSYAMGTGVKPPEDDITYDIDEGVKFNILTAAHPDPVEIKKLLKEALSGHTELGVHIKEPCVRVIYAEDGQEKYHVDLAVYATNGQNQTDSVIQLGRGKEFSDKENRYWQDAQPEQLINLINNKFFDKRHREQFRRIIRYLKRWKDVNFFLGGNSSPRGIAITIAAYNYFIPKFDSEGNPSDVDALIYLISTILRNKNAIYQDGEMHERIICLLPVSPHNDLFGKMTNVQMRQFINRLSNLNTSLGTATSEEDEKEACLKLAEVFGDDFPAEDLVKSFQIVAKPSIGYHPSLQRITGYDNAPYTVPLRGELFTKRGKVPFVSNKKILGPGHKLEFRAEISKNQDAEVLWRVVNTGSHCVELAKTEGEEEIFRGNLQKAHILHSNTVITSPDPRVTQESTLYTGKHWIECLLVKGNVCVGRSKKFFVNIYNPQFIRYV